LSFICFALSTDLQTSSGRAVAYGQIGVNGDCFLVSAQYQTKPTGGSGDVFAAAMGKNIAGFGYPWTALGYVRGSYDLDYYQSQLDRVTADAQGAVVAWAFVAVGEFCDMNGREGFQNNTSDFIIKYFTAPLGAPYTQTCGVNNNDQGETSYYSSVVSNLNIFNTTCKIFPKDTQRSRYIRKYDFKCDVTLDYTLLWETNTVAINNCPDNQRKVGIMLNLVGSAFDVDVSIDTNFNRRSGNVVDADSVSFGGGKLLFAWDNYVKTYPNAGLVGTSGTAARVTYGYLNAGNSSATYQGATVVHQVIFAFSDSKATGRNVFYWDPAIKVNAGPATFAPLFGTILTILSIVFLF